MTNVLIVDDEPLILSSFSRALRTNPQYKVWTASNAHKAFGILTKKPIDLVISDIVMPGMNGISMTELILRHWPELKVILVTGYHSINAEDIAKKAGASNYLIKPVSIHMLRKAVEYTLGKSHTAEQPVAMGF